MLYFFQTESSVDFIALFKVYRTDYKLKKDP